MGVLPGEGCGVLVNLWIEVTYIVGVAQKLLLRQLGNLQDGGGMGNP